MPESMQAGVLDKMRDFYYKNSAKEKTGSNLNAGRGKVDTMTVEKVLSEMQQLIFATPVYGIWKNPDLGRDIPQSLPLSAFNLQGPNEPLRLDLL